MWRKHIHYLINQRMLHQLAIYPKLQFCLSVIISKLIDTLAYMVMLCLCVVNYVMSADFSICDATEKSSVENNWNSLSK